MWLTTVLGLDQWNCMCIGLWMIDAVLNFPSTMIKQFIIALATLVMHAIHTPSRYINMHPFIIIHSCGFCQPGSNYLSAIYSVIFLLCRFPVSLLVVMWIWLPRQHQDACVEINDCNLLKTWALTCLIPLNTTIRGIYSYTQLSSTTFILLCPIYKHHNTYNPALPHTQVLSQLGYEPPKKFIIMQIWGIAIHLQQLHRVRRLRCYLL